MEPNIAVTLRPHKTTRETLFCCVPKRKTIFAARPRVNEGPENDDAWKLLRLAVPKTPEHDWKLLFSLRSQSPN